MLIVGLQKGPRFGYSYVCCRAATASPLYGTNSATTRPPGPFPFHPVGRSQAGRPSPPPVRGARDARKTFFRADTKGCAAHHRIRVVEVVVYAEHQQSLTQCCKDFHVVVHTAQQTDCSEPEPCIDEQSERASTSG